MKRWATLTDELTFSEITFDGEWYRVRITDEAGQVLMENESISLQGAKKQVKRFVGGTKKIRWNLVETDKIELPGALHLPLNHLSSAQVKTYLTCPKQYEMKYVDKIPESPGSAQFMERAFRISMRNAMRKKAAGQPIGTRDILDIYAQSIEREISKQDITWKDGEDAAITKDQGIRLMRGYYEEYGKDLTPFVDAAGNVHSEQVAKYDIVPGLKVRDVVHLIDEDLVVRDYRVGNGFPDRTIEDRIDMPIHALTARHLTQQQEKGTSIDHVFMIGDERKIIRENITGPILDQRIERTKETFVGVAKAISAGLFYPVEHSRQCGSCPFAASCNK